MVASALGSSQDASSSHVDNAVSYLDRCAIIPLGNDREGNVVYFYFKEKRCVYVTVRLQCASDAEHFKITDK